jgi:hypothetical protein
MQGKELEMVMMVIVMVMVMIVVVMVLQTGLRELLDFFRREGFDELTLTITIIRHGD